MAEARAAIDVIDRELVAVLARRQRYIERVVTIKQREGLPAAIPTRVEEVVANVVTQAREADLDPGVAEAVWRAMIAGFIAFEERGLGGS